MTSAGLRSIRWKRDAMAFGTMYIPVNNCVGAAPSDLKQFLFSPVKCMKHLRRKDLYLTQSISPARAHNSNEIRPSQPPERFAIAGWNGETPGINL